MGKKDKNVEVIFSEKSNRTNELLKKGMENDKKIVFLTKEIDKLHNTLSAANTEEEIAEIETEIEKIETDTEKLKSENKKIDDELEGLSEARILENERLLRGKWPRNNN